MPSNSATGPICSELGHKAAPDGFVAKNTDLYLQPKRSQKKVKTKRLKNQSAVSNAKRAGLKMGGAHVKFKFLEL